MHVYRVHVSAAAHTHFDGCTFAHVDIEAETAEEAVEALQGHEWKVSLEDDRRWYLNHPHLWCCPESLPSSAEDRALVLSNITCWSDEDMDRCD